MRCSSQRFGRHSPYEPLHVAGMAAEPPDAGLHPPAQPVNDVVPSVEATLAPHRGVVTVERSSFGGMRWYLVHSISQEQELLPPPASGGYELAFDEAGFGMVCDGPEEIGADQLLRKGVYHVERDYLLVGADGEKSYLSELSGSWLPCQWSSVGGLHPELVCFVAARYRLPKNGCCVCWSLENLYTVLGLTQKSGVPSRWVFRCFGAWEKVPAVLGPSAQLARSRQYSGVDGEYNGDRTLPWVGASSSLLLGLLVRWSCLPRAGGGFEQGENKQRAANVLSAIVEYCLQAGPVGLTIFVDEGAERQHPHWPTGEHPMEIIVPASMSNLQLLPLCEVGWGEQYSEGAARKPSRQYRQRRSPSMAARSS